MPSGAQPAAGRSGVVAPGSLGLPAVRQDAAAHPDGMPLGGPLVDTFGRVATDLRVSLTDRCNLRCTYCMPAEGLDWLPGAEPTAWRFGRQTPDLASLGVAMAADPAIAECAVARLWNWALGRGDIVDTLATVPTEVITAQVAAFTANGMKLKDAIFAVYASDDFVRF